MVSHPSCRRSIVGEDSIWAVIYDMRIVDDGSPAPTFWSFVLGHNLSPVEQQRHWLEDTVCLELIRHEDGSIVIISKISEVITSKCSAFMLWNLHVIQQQFWMKNMWHFQGVKAYPDPLHFFQGVRTPVTPQDLRPWVLSSWSHTVLNSWSHFWHQ